MNYWQGLGAFCADAANLSQQNIADFADAGGCWVALLVQGDDHNTPGNIDLLTELQNELHARNIALWGWHNYWGEDADHFAVILHELQEQYGLGNHILDCEAAVQGNTKMSQVALAVHQRIGPGFGVSTNSLNDSVVYNGRLDGVDPALWQSFRQLQIRVLPQWYQSPLYSGTWVDPVENMQWLQSEAGASDNLHDARAAKWGYHAVPLSYVHPTGEGTGIEGASWQQFLDKCVEAQKFGLTKGISYYLLEESSTVQDMAIVKQYRGKLYV